MPRDKLKGLIESTAPSQDDAPEERESTWSNVHFYNHTDEWIVNNLIERGFTTRQIDAMRYEGKGFRDVGDPGDESALVHDDMTGRVGAGYEDISESAVSGTDRIIDDMSSGYDDILPIEHRGNIESQAGEAFADAGMVDAQRDALNQYGDLTSPEMTAAEHAMLEQNRRAQDQSNRSAREAVLRDMEMRGVGGSGMELTSNLDAMSTNADRRMMQDLGAQGQAVNRSMQALQGYGNLASAGREQSFGEALSRGGAVDSIAKFNAGIDQSTDIFNTQTAMDKVGNQASVGLQATKDRFGYKAEPLQFDERSTGNKVAIGSEDQATRDARDAAELAAEEDFDPLSPSTWDKLWD